MVPHFPGIGSGGMPPVPPTILMSGPGYKLFKFQNTLLLQSKHKAMSLNQWAIPYMNSGRVK